MTSPTAAERRPELVTREIPERRAAWARDATSADHKTVAKLFIGTSLTFLAVAALQFLLVRLQLIVPDSTILVPEVFNRINSAAQATAVIFFAVPLFLGIIGYIVPLQIGARGVALPRLNQLSYWLYAAGAFFFYASFLYTVPETALSPLPPLSDDIFSPSGGVDAWVGGVALATLGFVCFAVNLIATLRTMRAPGLAWRRTPAFTWAAATIGYVLLVVGPAMLAALTMLTIDRHFDGVFFDAGEGGEPLLFTHLSWIYFSGLHAVLLVGAAGAVSEIVQTFARKPLLSHTAVGRSLAALGALGVLAWMQNMYDSPIPDGFAYVAMGAAVAMLVPMGVLIFNWIATLWEGSIRTGGAIAMAVGSAVLMTFALAGELMTSIIPVGLQLENTVAAQQDTIVFFLGAAVLGGFAALHYWLPKISGRAVGDGLASAALGLIVLGATLFGFAMFFAGLQGQPVDISRYVDGTGLQGYNIVAAVGALFIFLGVLAELVNLARSYTAGRPVGHDPYAGSTLEWLALSPPPPHNFDAIPDVRSPEPLRDIREAIRAREAAYVPPAPLPRSAAPVASEPEPVAVSEAAEPAPPEPDEPEAPADGDARGDAPVA